MRGSPPPHSVVLVSSNTKWAYAVTVDMSVVSISEGPRANIVHWRSRFADAQCEAFRGRIRRLQDSQQQLHIAFNGER